MKVFVVCVILFLYAFHKIPAVKFVVKGLGLMLGIIAGAFWGLLVGILGYEKDLSFAVAQWTTTVLAPLMGIEFRIRGQETLFQTEKPYVIVSNHQSTLDIVTMTSVYPRDCVAIAKKEIQRIPILGLWARKARHVFIDRKDPSAAIETMKGVAEQLKNQKTAIWIYPEGTRAHIDGGMLPFKKGAFHIAISGQLPIIPVVIGAYNDVYSTKRWRFEGGAVHVRVLDPIPTTGMTKADVDTLIETTRSRMLDTLREISETTKSKFL